MLVDTRFYYGLDNPFSDDPMGDKKRKLKKYISLHGDSFLELNYLVNNRFMILFPEITELFGTEVSNSDLTGTTFNNKLKQIIADSPCASDELKQWGSKLDPIPEPPKEEPPAPVQQGGNVTSVIQPQQQQQQPTIPPQVPIHVPQSEQIQLNLAKILEGGTMYDMYSERTLTYDELRTISINIARSLLDPKQKSDDTLAELENEERRRLINAIQEFKNVTVISPYIEDDIGKMSVEQLKNLREKCEKLHSQFKVNEVLKSGFNVCSMAYDTLFPEGIPISKNKHLQFGGIGEELKSKLLDNTKTIGFGFSRFLQKHDINITDELTILITMGEIIASKAKVVTNDPNSETTNGSASKSHDVSDEEDKPPELSEI